jgi:hypothetical protein
MDDQRIDRASGGSMNDPGGGPGLDRLDFLFKLAPFVIIFGILGGLTCFTLLVNWLNKPRNPQESEAEKKSDPTT